MSRILCTIVAFCVLSEANAIANSDQDFSSLVHQGSLQYQTGAYAAAEASFAAALRAVEPGHDGDRAEVLVKLGHVYSSEDKLSNAEQAYRESLAIYKRFKAETEVAMVLRHLAGVYALERRDDDAMRVLQQALKWARTNHNVRLEIEVLNIIGVVYYRQGKNKSAANYFNQALAMSSEAGISPDLSELLNNLGNVYQSEHKYTEAEAFLKRALSHTESELGLSHPDLTFTLYSLGYLYTSMRRYSDAEDQFRRALALLEPKPDEFQTRIARVLHAFAVLYAKTGRKEESDAALERAAIIARANLTQHADLEGIMKDYAASLKNHGRAGDAEQILSELRQARGAAALVVASPAQF
jgi:tetratricopeptide (TPR) repeat protein